MRKWNLPLIVPKLPNKKCGEKRKNTKEFVTAVVEENGGKGEEEEGKVEKTKK